MTLLVLFIIWLAGLLSCEASGLDPWKWWC